MRRTWTKQEELYLMKKYSTQETAVTAERLQRSVSSVRRKANKLGLNRRFDLVSANTIAQCFHVDRIVVIRWIDHLGLPCTIFKDHNHRRYFDINVDMFWQWAEKYHNEINWARYESHSIALEPDWVKNKQKECHAKKSRMRWTAEEERQLQNMLRRGLPYAEIGQELGRSVDSIKHHVRLLYDKKKKNKMKIKQQED